MFVISKKSTAQNLLHVLYFLKMPGVIRIFLPNWFVSGREKYEKRSLHGCTLPTLRDYHSVQGVQLAKELNSYYLSSA